LRPHYTALAREAGQRDCAADLFLVSGAEVFRTQLGLDEPITHLVILISYRPT
jgi:hypothetical protein